jgi:hypothetical protein
MQLEADDQRIVDEVNFLLFYAINCQFSIEHSAAVVH